MVKYKGKAILTVGLPGCGKSTWANQYAKENKNWVIIERDKWRAEVYTDFPDYTFDNAAEKLVTELSKWSIQTAIKNGQNIIISDTNLNEVYYDELLIMFEDNRYTVRFQHFTDVPISRVLEQNKNRDAEVPEGVIHRMASSRPDLFVHAKEFSKIDEDTKLGIIIDLDGSLVVTSPHRSKFSQDAYHLDVVWGPVVCLLENMIKEEKDLHVEVITSRNERGREEVQEFLEENCSWLTSSTNYRLTMRSENDHRSCGVYKKSVIKGFQKEGIVFALAVEDQDDVTAMLKGLGIPTIQIHQGGMIRKAAYDSMDGFALDFIN